MQYIELALIKQGKAASYIVHQNKGLIKIPMKRGKVCAYNLR